MADNRFPVTPGYISPMPIYEYHCPSCGKEFELLVRGETRVACPGCDSPKIERRMSVTARPAGGGSAMDLSNLGPPNGGGGCGGGGCGCH
jgi:putative FmdB family regulatory protein